MMKAQKHTDFLELAAPNRALFCSILPSGLLTMMRLRSREKYPNHHPSHHPNFLACPSCERQHLESRFIQKSKLCIQKVWYVFRKTGKQPIWQQQPILASSQGSPEQDGRSYLFSHHPSIILAEGSPNNKKKTRFGHFLTRLLWRI